MPQDIAHGGYDDGLLGRVLFRQVEGRRERRVIRRERRDLLGAEPPDDRVIARVAIRVFHCELRLAHAAEPGERRRAAGAQCVVQVRKTLAGFGKVRIAQVRDVPDVRQHPGWTRLRVRGGIGPPRK